MSGSPLHALHGADPHRPTSTPKGIATAHFGMLRDPLVRFINGSEIVVGCVAWATDRDILAALARRPVALVVQKETWWKRTDVRGQALAKRYAALKGTLPASAFPEPLASAGDIPLAPIACVGYGSGAQHQPLMHHKFIVRCTVVDDVLVPLAVWTGSFNFSGNANDSFENAVEIHDPSIAGAYLAEFALVASVSESMNWRLAKPTPKGVGKPFVAPTAKKTQARTAKPAAKRPASRRRKPAAKKTTVARPATITAPRKVAAKKTTAKRPATRRRTAA